MPRYEYNRSFDPIPLDHGPNGEEVQVIVRMRVEEGRLIRMCVGLQVKSPGSPRFREIVRYDDSHGEPQEPGPVFHRHGPDDPPKAEDREYLRHVARGLEVQYAMAQLELHADRYIVEAMQTDYEVQAEDEEVAE